MIHTGNNPFEVHASVINIMSVTGEVGKNLYTSDFNIEIPFYSKYSASFDSKF